MRSFGASTLSSEDTRNESRAGVSFAADFFASVKLHSFNQRIRETDENLVPLGYVCPLNRFLSQAIGLQCFSCKLTHLLRHFARSAVVYGNKVIDSLGASHYQSIGTGGSSAY